VKINLVNMYERGGKKITQNFIPFEFGSFVTEKAIKLLIAGISIG